MKYIILYHHLYILFLAIYALYSSFQSINDFIYLQKQ